MLQVMRGHFARLGGVLIRPRSTLMSILRGEQGTAWEILPWIAIACASAAPTETGRALLMMRIEPLMGAWSMLSMIADRTSLGLIGAAVAAFLLGLLKIPFDRAFDCTFYMLVPFVLLMALGSGLSTLDAELWFLPHRRLTGVPWVIAVRVLAAYGWSLLLFAIVVRAILVERRTIVTSPNS